MCIDSFGNFLRGWRGRSFHSRAWSGWRFLFRSLNDDDHIQYFKAHGEIIWNTLTESLSDYPPFKGLTDEQIYQVQLTRWLLAHGLAVQVSTHPPGVWDDERVVLIIRQGSTAILEGLRQQFTP